MSLNLQGDDHISDDQLKKMIGKMLMVGFNEHKVNKNTPIVQTIQKYDLGGVILFDRFYKERSKVKNISSPKQLQELTSSLQSYSHNKLLIALDQEGGKVQRLKERDGFTSTPSAKDIGKGSFKEARKDYDTLASMLQINGINCDLAPVVDMEVNKDNFVIAGLKRSFGSSAKKVAKYASVFIDAMDSKHIISVLKHFPGHGSSFGDTHKGFVDVTNTWSEKELDPYKILIAQNKVKMIMTAHIFNKHLDEKYPATLSYNVNTKLLRDKLHFQGVIISDDLQMKAISKYYTLEQTVTLAINAGIDILLFGNQLAYNDPEMIINTIFQQVKKGAISIKRIEEANIRIEELETVLKK